MSRTERKHVDDGRDLGVRLTEKTADALKKSLRSLPARRASATKHQTQSTIRTIRTMGDRHIGEALHAPDQRPLQEVREPRPRRQPPLPALQLRRIHQTIRCTPAMEAGLTDTLHDMEWLMDVIERYD